MAILGRLRGKRDDDDDLDELDDESLDDDEESSPGLLGRMRMKLKRSAGDDEDDLDDLLDDEGGGSPGLLGRMRRKLMKGGDEDDEDDSGAQPPAPERSTGDGGGSAVPVNVVAEPSAGAVEATDAANVSPDDASNTASNAAPGKPPEGGATPNAQPNADSPAGAPTAVYIVDGPEGGGDEQAGPNTANEADTQANTGDPKPDSPGEVGSGLDLMDIFEEEEEVDEAFQDLVNSVGEITASDLATQLQEIMSSLDNKS